MANRIFILGIMLWLPAGITAADLTVKLADKQPPQEISEAIRQTLEPKAVQLLDGETPLLEFWMRKDVPLKSAPPSPEKALDVFVQPEVIAAAAVHKDRRDYKDNELPKGIYTVRFGLQPQDGNHLGTSDYVFFAVLIPADRDTTLDGIKNYKALVRVSSKGTSTDHPVIISLRPASASAASAELPKINEPVSEHRSIIMKCQAKAAGANEPTTALFEIVFEGKAHTN